MRIQFSKSPPSTKELVEVLKQRFSSKYTIKTFGMGNRSISIGKSTLVGAEISVHKNTISFSSSPPSVFGGILMALGMTEFAIFLFPFFFKNGLSPQASYSALEHEVGAFLLQTFH